MSDKDLIFLRGEGLTGSLTDMSYEFLQNQTGLTLSRGDMLIVYLKSLGYIGETPSDILQHAADVAGVSGVNELITRLGIFETIRAPLARLPLIDNLDLEFGTGSATFTRSTIGTFVDKDDGLVKTAAIDAARFEQNGILIEGASTNLLLRSEEFDNAAWVIVNGPGTKTANTTAAPDGAITADTLADTNVTNFTRMEQVITIAADTVTRTYYIFIKKTSGATVFPGLGLQHGAAAKQVFINTNTGVVTPRSGFGPDDFSSKLINGYYRISITQANNSSTSAVVSIFPAFSSDGTTLGATSLTGSVIVWGAQLEQLPFASSYIKTVASTVTRTADNLSIDAANIPAPTLDYSVSATVDILGDVDTVDQALFRVEGETTRQALSNHASANKFRANLGGTILDGTELVAPSIEKQVITKDSIIAKMYQGGVETASGVQGAVTGTATSISIGVAAGGSHLFGHMRNFRTYAVRLTDNQVATL